MAPLRIVFMGTAPLSCVCLRALIASPGFEVAAVVTQPDKPKGRELKLAPSPVKELAQQRNLPILQPSLARELGFFRALEAAAPDLVVVAAYGQILPQSVLDLPRHGCLNVHTSLLPKYRGAAPIQWALLNGEPETGITIMRMDAGLDTGDILTQARIPIQPQDTSETLHDRLARVGANLLVLTIPEYIGGAVRPQPQPSEGVSLAPKIRKEDGHIDWSQTALSISNRVRALVPWPGAFTHLQVQAHPCLLKIWQAEIVQASGQPGEILEASKASLVVGCGQDALRTLVLQREGGRRLTAQQFLSGHPLKPGDRLESSKEAPRSKIQDPEQLQPPTSNPPLPAPPADHGPSNS